MTESTSTAASHFDSYMVGMYDLGAVSEDAMDGNQFVRESLGDRGEATTIG